MLFDSFSKFRKWGMCNCNSMQRYANDPASPIKYDKDLNEYNILYDNHHLIVYYCFFCGGNLPKSRRGELFAKTSKIELIKARRLIGKINNERDIIEIMGPPDSKISIADFADSDVIKNHFKRGLKSQYTYTSKWETLKVDFEIYDDGTVHPSVSGKFIGEKERK